jgi:hemerythrin-like metal-binding protein
MKKVEWSESYAIGVGVIDYQHRKLIRLIGDLQEYKDKKEFSDDVLDLILEELVDYTEYHFSTEENYMHQVNYPDLETHKVKHKNFVNKLQSLKEQFHSRNTEITDELERFLSSWLITHIAHEDTLIKQHVTCGGGLV